VKITSTVWRITKCEANSVAHEGYDHRHVFIVQENIFGHTFKKNAHIESQVQTRAVFRKFTRVCVNKTKLRLA